MCYQNIFSECLLLLASLQTEGKQTHILHKYIVDKGTKTVIYIVILLGNVCLGNISLLLPLSPFPSPCLLLVRTVECTFNLATVLSHFMLKTETASLKKSYISF